MFQDTKSLDSPIEDIIQNEPFWPTISINDFVKACRIPPVYNAEQSRNMLIMTMAGVNVDLTGFQQTAESDGYTSLDEMDNKLRKNKALISLYKEAIYQRAKAGLLVHFATLNQKPEAENLAKESKETHEALMTNSQRAIRTILGMTMVTVRLL
ncbi:head completion/stabilization protein [Aliivibrio fischeri]|uniref:Head protein n=1 Tax=Aliivibrio fischeri TaxID=668 RepID=A0A510UF27_ALIFS|nr:head completion/stabilization protein [Aliivibrio fischeri]GEK13228.1 hypothetical protein AFI02nite_12640 [Aliivibrio fischeri]